MTRLDWFLRNASVRMGRRQIGVLGAALIAALGDDPRPASGRKQRRKTKRDKPRRGKGRRCGGLTGKPCPDGFTCVDDPGDDCDPTAGGADCLGACVRIEADPCATVRCRKGTKCCPRCGRICIPDEIPCSSDGCPGERCNTTICGPGEYCCNESCSRCAPRGHACTTEVCAPQDPGGTPCGKVVCPRGQVCCNASCGICAPPRVACLMIACEGGIAN